MPHLPYLPFPKEELTLLENKQLGNFGRIKRLVLSFHEEPVPKIFQGVRVQRANMMITKIPFEVYEKKYQNRFSGYIEFDSSLEFVLKKIERTDHSGFLYESPWKEIKNLVRDENKKFVDTKVSGKERKKPPLGNMDKIIQKANQIISDNCPDVLGSGHYVPPITPKPKPPLRIKYLTINKREVTYKDIVKPSCTIINETDENKKFLLKVELKKKGSRINKEEYNLRIDSKKQRTVKLSNIELKKENYQAGKYTIRVTIEEDRHDINTKATSFYLEVKREPSKRGFVKAAEFIEIDEPIRNEPINKGIVKINLAHKDFMNILDSFNERKRQLNEQMGFYIIKICLNEATNELFKLKLKYSNVDLDALLREISQLRDKMYYETYV